MDHHDDWAPWHDEQPNPDGADTADLGGPDFGLDGHDTFHGYDTPEGPGDGDLVHDGAHHDGPANGDADAPDLVNDSGGGLEHSSDDGQVPVDGHEEGLSEVDGHEEGLSAADGHEEGLSPVDTAHGDDPVGSDPDLPVDHDGGWHDDDFPPPLELGQASPEPL